MQGAQSSVWAYWINNHVLMGSWILLAVLSIVFAIAWARKNARESLGILGLLGLSVLVRVAAAPRVPMAPGNADFTHLSEVGMWIRDGLFGEVSFAYPAAWKVVIYMAFRVAHPSPELAFWLTTLAGCLTVVPVYLLGRRVTGSALGGVLAALVMATHPMAVFFGNGVSLETPSALLLVLSFVGLYRFLDRGDPASAAFYALPTLLFTECRLEALGVLPALLSGQFGLALLQKKGGMLWSRRYVLLGLSLLIIPYVTFMLLYGVDVVREGYPQRMLGISLGAVAFVVAVLALDRFVLVRKWGRLAFNAAVGMAFVWFVVHLWRCAGACFLVSPDHLADLAHTAKYASCSEGEKWVVLSSGVFPALLPLLGVVSLVMPARDSAEPNHRYFLLVAAYLIWAGQYLITTLTGNLIAEGARYQVLYLGLVAVMAGSGAFALAQGLRKLRLPEWLAQGVAVLLVASSVATHWGFMTDVRHNQQAEYEFARSALKVIPERSTIGFPDFGIEVVEEGTHQVDVSRVFRTRDLLDGVAVSDSKWIHAMPLSLLPRKQPSKPFFVYLGLDCYRVPNGEPVHPFCQRLRAGDIGEVVLQRTLENRRYSGAWSHKIGPSGPFVELTMVKIAPKDYARFKEVSALCVPFEHVEQPPHGSDAER